ncbi:ComEA family DNA-binding protein [Zhihengliuella alba]|uniref:ComEA family DNA-binding protein n=1 Tax=Zhihengliuella alba TaxID=547018 RepID=UPI0031EB8E44
MVRHRWQTRPGAGSQPPPPPRFRLTFGRGVLLCVLVGVLAWVAVSLVVRPLVLNPGTVGTVALERESAGGSAEEEAAGAGRSGSAGEDHGGAPQPGLTDRSSRPSAESRAGAGGASASAVAAPEVVLVHVAGAVQHPGVYELPAGARVQAAVEAAGGPTAEAETSAVNLAAEAVDGQQILIPTVGEAVAGLPGGAPSAGAAASGGIVPINTADAAELEQLPGIGPALAARIVEFREANGAFHDLADVDAVSGIGPAMMEQLDGLVSF